MEPTASVAAHDQNACNLAAQFSTIGFTDASNHAINAWKATPKSAKVKTRGNPILPVLEPQDGLQQNIVDDRSPAVHVNKKAFDVFTTLFHKPTKEKLPGEVPWSDFLSAMANVRFSVKKLDGSAWLFKPQDDIYDQSIIFHEPHPSSKIPFRLARRYGRRLFRAYGWSGESFVRD